MNTTKDLTPEEIEAIRVKTLNRIAPPKYAGFEMYAYQRISNICWAKILDSTYLKTKNGT